MAKKKQEETNPRIRYELWARLMAQMVAGKSADEIERELLKSPPSANTVKLYCDDRETAHLAKKRAALAAGDVNSFDKLIKTEESWYLEKDAFSW